MRGLQRPEAVQEVPTRDQGGQKGPVDGDGEGQEGVPMGDGGYGEDGPAGALNVLVEKNALGRVKYRNVCVHLIDMI